VTAPAQNPPAPQALAAFADPSAVGGTRPAIRDLVGRVVVIRPTRYEPSAPAVKPGETQERVTADILIVTGGPLEFGGNLVTANKPHTHRVQTPYLAKGVYISNTNIVNSVKDMTGKAPVLGRVAIGVTNTPGNNAPYNLLTVAQTEPEYALAGQLYAQVLNDTFVNPTPETIGAAPVAAPAQNVGQLQQQIAQATTQVQAGGPVPAAPTLDPAAAFQAWLASQQQTVPAAAPSLPPAPAGWNTDVWAGLTDAQRTQVLSGAPF
jgi:hypothetical protein